MDSSSFTGLLNNAALLIALGVIYDALGLDAVVNQTKRQLLSGLLVGVLGLAVMNTAWELAPGLIFDTRWVLISLCGLFFGTVPTLIAATIMVAQRLYIGGAGGMVGSLVIIIPACIGLVWRYASERLHQPLDWLRLYLFGLLIQLCVLSLLLLMPVSLRFTIIGELWLPLITIFPVGTMLLGLVLRRQRDRRKAERELIASQHLLDRERGLLRGLVDSLPDLISFKDTQGRYMGCNQAFERYTGLSEAELIGKTEQQLTATANPSDLTELGDSELSTSQKPHNHEEWVTYPNGSQVLHETLKTRFHGQDGTLFGLVSVSRDITERKTAEEQIRNLAFYDPLTQLPNRRMLMDRLQLTISASARSHDHGALFFIDLDHFKTLNDTQGHNVGDQLLIAVAARLSDCLRDVDSVARLGGDEFVAMICNLGSEKISAAGTAEGIAEKIRLSLCEPYQLNTALASAPKQLLLYHCTPSIGISLFRSDLGNRDEILKQADVAMYQSKAAGRNTIRFFDPEMQASLEKNSALLSDLHDAISGDQLELFYQVQIDQHQGICGAEVLLRWHHATRGMVSPLDFIPLAEESGLIIPIGRWVLITACQQLKIWAAQESRKDWQIAVNVSARQFQQPRFVEEVRDIIAAATIDPARLKLELTESLVLDDVERTIATMQQLNQLGVQFSMDDFGTGQSSLSNLKRLPLQQLKIDQSFVRDITTDPDDAAIVKAIISLSQSLKYDVIAEGVETDEQRQFLYDNGCSHYQGYLFSRPLPVSEFEALVESGSLLAGSAPTAAIANASTLHP
ncbi:MAG: EAL domain-containing protein [Motiliproteus sp.]